MIENETDDDHGGQLGDAVRRYGISKNQWIDLSTGINPVGWPVPAIPANCFRRLPDESDSFTNVIQHYYGSDSYLTGAGSQAFIQMLPVCWSQSHAPTARVGVLSLSYCEHRLAWLRHGHEIVLVDEDEVETALPELDVLILVNPNNPTGKLFSKSSIRRWLRLLQNKAGWLIVDEAFMDSTPDLSVAGDESIVGQDGFILLRSIGKFFGLAGIRWGLMMADKQVLSAMTSLIGPWPVSGPALWIAERALADKAWQRHTIDDLAERSTRLKEVLTRTLGTEIGHLSGTSLFVSVYFKQKNHARFAHQQLAEQGVLTRLFSSANLLRFGLPEGESEWLTLERALSFGL